MRDATEPETVSHAGAERPRTVAVLLAAGAGSRFTADRHKLSALLPRRGAEPPQSVIERSLTHLLAAAVGTVVVVTGAVPDIVPAGLLDAVLVRHNDRWAQGQSTSLRLGIEAAMALDATSVVVGLADQPFVTADAWRRVAATEGPIAVATYDGRRANPVRLDAEIWDLLPDVGDVGARSLMRIRPDLVREVPCTGSPADIDTTEDLSRWQSN